jgi:ubiquinone/menaquinone biosynthesis C-methylase UbiE
VARADQVQNAASGPDIGAGIGGPARWIATNFGCEVTGVELKPEYCAAAAELNAASGLSGRVRVVEGNALALPLPDGGFDSVYSHNVVMCVADKPGFWREALRVLRPGGTLAAIWQAPMRWAGTNEGRS